MTKEKSEEKENVIDKFKLEDDTWAETFDRLVKNGFYTDKELEEKYNRMVPQYESPITAYVEQWVNHITEQRDNAIVAEINERYSLNVNKEELEKALAYDRNQYMVGWNDAVNSLSAKIPQWIPVEERLPFGEDEVLCFGCHDWHNIFSDYGVGRIIYDNDDEMYVAKNDCGLVMINVVAWMPLPQPYKKGSDE